VQLISWSTLVDGGTSDQASEILETRLGSSARPVSRLESVAC